ncbi:KH domain protein [Gregarina niphandrodes]|uniref:KH domain protein n=1 Tax=Gregarina niphandrodes TaxID=110365 RepID=A0A023B7A5_GRENI|nr:KH domain protein [Gregarina niphandrodes]EZG67152.1 KH domain protein [Gregarina niphandrodes]|eukprot:XP_011130321.1 KH domain protein [Gregarina niphandrodes]
MSGLFGWATDALASVTSSVMAPFRGGAAPPLAAHEFQVPKTRNPQVKKRAQPKRRVQQRKQVDESRGEESASVYEPDEGTKLILARMAEAAEQRAAEEAAEEEAEQERIAARAAALANSVVKDLPADPLKKERETVLADLKKRLTAIGTGEGLRYEQLLDQVSQLHGQFDDLNATIDDQIRAMQKKCPRVPSDKAQKTIEELRDMVQTEELKAEPNDLEINSLISGLVAVISQQNQRVWQDRMYDLMNDVASARASLVYNVEKARENDSLNRALDRLSMLFDSYEKPVKLVKEKVVGQNLEVPVEFNRITPFSRKIERRFKCIIMPVGRRSSVATRTSLRVWGYKEEVADCVEWMKSCDWTGGASRAYDRRVAGMIIGRAGATITQIEQDTGTILNLDNNNLLTVYGPAAAVEEVWKRVDELKADTRVAQTTENFTIDPRVGRAIVSVHRPVMSAIEASHKARVTVLLQPDDGKPRIIMRCPAEKAEECRKEVCEKLVENFVILEYTASARAISRVLAPSKQVTSRAFQINNQFKTLQQTYGLFAQREEMPEMSDMSCLWVICAKSDKAAVNEGLIRLLDSAEYTVERISIMREQQRVFNAENRSLIEASSGCQVSIQNNPQEGARLNLVGSAEEIKQAKTIIEQILEEQGAVETLKLEGPATVDYLLRDRGAMIRALEDMHAVSIHVDRTLNTARIVGDRNAIEETVQEIKDVEAEQAKASADTIRLVISINGDRVPMLIGRGGSTIQQIRRIPGVQSIEVPNDVDPDSTVEIVLVGRTAALEEAEAFIEDLVSRQPRQTQTEPVDYAKRAGRGRGRGRARERDTASTDTPTAVATPLAGYHMDAAAFPPLAFADA